MITSVDRIESLVSSWRQEAARRRAMSAHDVGADLLEYCAGELHSELRDVIDADEPIGPDAYAALHKVSVSTVRRWCKSGALPATKKGREWSIRRGEPTPAFGVLAA